MCQLLIAHKFTPKDFAVFNSLLAIFMLVSNPLDILQLVVAKYCSDFNARGEINKVKALISGLFRKCIIFAIATFILSAFFSFIIMRSLRIDSYFSGSIFTLLLTFYWLTPILGGGLLGLELFGWFVSLALLSRIVKLIFTALFILLSFQIAGALGALLISIIIGVTIAVIPLRKFLTDIKPDGELNYKEMLLYLSPIAISNICFVWLVSFDMVLVQYFFSGQESGVYSLARMVGKIVLFSSGAISIVMFPRTSFLNATDSNTSVVLNKSLLYVFCFSISAALFYNIFPSFVLRILTGKALVESIVLGRLFSVSMTFFALCFILINYFLSLRSLKFIKYLILSVALQFIGIVLFHNSLIQVQIVLCFNSFLLFVLLISKSRFKVNNGRVIQNEIRPQFL
ncbi:MAG: hypothetical protein KKG43_01820 [Candidatus Omnitrophica bacterium]|nr:hypothetical protein [Candidatus Omnitrophota bacterium]MBU1929260.1 hypothetical protein [Candidatus Omnitrophota bacterium]